MNKSGVPGFSPDSAFPSVRNTTDVKVAGMTARGGHPSDENLLQLIAAKEKELESKVAQGREQARLLVEDAQRQAAVIREQATREATELTGQTEAEIAREHEAVAAERMKKAQTEAEQLRARAAERMAAAVSLVVKRVLDGLSENQSADW